MGRRSATQKKTAGLCGGADGGRDVSKSEILTKALTFSRYVNPDDGIQCWDWNGGKSRGKCVMRCPVSKNRVLSARRVAWEVFKGPIPDWLFVLPRCLNRDCVNPSHLFLADNVERGSWRARLAKEAKAPVSGGSPDALD